MIKYSLKRLLYMIPVTVAVIFIVYLIMYLTPGDPVALLLGADATPELIVETRQKLGITDPFFVQLGRYIWNLLHGDFGMSWYTGNPVSERLFAAIPYTVTLSLLGMLVALIISVPLGVIAAVRRNSVWDYSISVFAMIGVSAPTFWVGTMLILLFALEWKMLPSAFNNDWTSFILPTITQGFNMLASVVRTQRSSMLEVLSSDYVRTARAKGVSELMVVVKHALKNALTPVITYLGPLVAGLLTGSFVVEKVFSIDGIGRYFVQMVSDRDYNMIMGIVIFYGAFVVICNLVSDILLAVVDPRVRYEK